LSSGAAGSPWAVTPGGLSVVVRLTPRGGGDAIDGIEQRSDGQYVLKARVRAAATEGEANAALVTLLRGPRASRRAMSRWWAARPRASSA
jgi:uncharacterized protein